VQLSQEVARASAQLHLADEAARAATVVRSHIALAAIGSEEQQRLSALEAESALDALTSSLAGLEASAGASDPVEAGMLFVGAARQVVDSIGSGEVDQEPADLRFHDMIASLDEMRRDLVEHIDLLDSSYNVLGIILGVATVGLAPLVLVLWTRSIARKTMEVRELSLQLKHESDLRDAHNSVLRTVVHEFRTPLTGITGLAALLEEPSVRRSSEAAEMVGMIRNEAEDMSQLTDDILTSAGLETGHLEIRVESVDLPEAVKRTVTMFERRGVGVEVACEPGAVIGDELRVRQIMKNLVSNAVKYGGPNITVSGEVVGGFYEVSVADDGDGVPDEIQDRLFEPFPHGGNGAPSQSVGLGLFIVHELVEAMSGGVEYARVDGTSIFTVRLPLDDQTKAARSLIPTLSVGA
jgi:signal transduction histidine kinase